MTDRTIYTLDVPKTLSDEEKQRVLSLFADTPGLVSIARTDVPDAEPKPTNFQQVSAMNDAFGNPKGDPANIDWSRIRSQCKNIFDEFVELQKALGLSKAGRVYLEDVQRQIVKFEYYDEDLDLNKVRDGLCDIHVFAYGAHHLMGIDADRDMQAVNKGLMTRFIKDDQDKEATIAMHAAKGVTDVYFVGEYPTMAMKAAQDYPDAPKDKFLKSASFEEEEFYDPRA